MYTKIIAYLLSRLSLGLGAVLSLPFTENWCRIVIFLIWESVIFLPWLILCRNKYKVSEPEFSRIGISGIFTQLFFLIGIELMLTKENLPLRSFVTETHISFELEISGN